MEWLRIKSFTIPEGIVKQVAIGDTVLWRKGLLPIGYTQLEWIQNSNRNWLDTGVMPSSDMVFETKLDFDVSKIGDNYFSSCRQDTGNTRYYLLNLNSTYTFACSNSVWGTNMASVQKAGVSTPFIIRSHIEETKVTLQVNDTESTKNLDLTVLPTASLPLFSGKTNISAASVNNPIPVNIKCYYARYIDHGVLIRDFVPCRRERDGKVGMFDLVQKEFIGSATDTNFIAGEYQNEYQQTANYIDDGVSFEVQPIEGQSLASDALSDVRFENIYKAGYENTPYTSSYDMVVRPNNASIKINVPSNKLPVKINLTYVNFPSGSSSSSSLNGSTAFWGLYNNDELIVKKDLMVAKEYELLPEGQMWNNIRFSTETTLTKPCIYQINMLKIGE